MPAAETFGGTIRRAGNDHCHDKQYHQTNAQRLAFWEQIQAVSRNGKVENREKEVEIAVEEKACEVG